MNDNQQHFDDKKHLLDILDVKDAFISQQQATIKQQSDEIERLKGLLSCTKYHIHGFGKDEIISKINEALNK